MTDSPAKTWGGRISSPLIAAIGFLVGTGVATWLTFVRYVEPARRDVADIYQIDVHRNIRACTLILEGNTNAARRMLEENLLVTAAGIKEAFPNHPGAQYHLWRIATYFATNHITPSGRFSNNVAGISLDFPTNSSPTVFYFDAYPSYYQSLINKGQRLQSDQKGQSQ